MDKRFILPPLLLIIIIFISLISSMSCERKKIARNSPQHLVIQYINSQTFSSRERQEEWLNLIPTLSEKMQNFSSDYNLAVLVDPEDHNLISILSKLPISIILDSSNPNHSPLFNIFNRFSSEDFLTIISPNFLCDLYKIAQTDEIFFDALLGLSLDPNQIYLFSHFDQGRFRVVPDLVLSLSAGFSKDFAQKLQNYALESTMAYRALLQTRNIYDPLSLSNNRDQRLQWLMQNPELSILEPGFFSQLDGEYFWQTLIWNCNSRYIIAPLNWPDFSSYTPYVPIIPFSEIAILFPESSKEISNMLLIYNDCMHAQHEDEVRACALFRELKACLKNISYLDQKKLEGAYGEDLIEKIMA